MTPRKIDVVDRLRKRAQEYGGDVSKWKMGDELHEEEFAKILPKRKMFSKR